MKFNNRLNECVKVGNRTIWISRSVAILAIPLFIYDSKVWVPLGKRSQNLPSERGKYGLVAGYLDWDETAAEAVIREVWEELGLNLLDLGEPYLGSLEQPYFVFSNPNGDAVQNVTLRFKFSFQVKELPSLTPGAEVDDCRWVELNEAVKMPLAFNHAEILSTIH